MPESISQQLRSISRLAKTDAQQALSQIQPLLLCSEIEPQEIEKAGRLIRKHLKTPDLKVLILGQCTTSWLCDILAAEGWKHGKAIKVHEGQYDTILQDLHTLTESETHFSSIVLLPWNQRLFERTANNVSDRIEEELGYWKQAWELIQNQFGASIVQVGYDWMESDSWGMNLGGTEGRPIDLIRRVNQAIREALPQGAYFIDLEQVSGLSGRQQFYESRRYIWTKQPFSEQGAVDICRHLWAGIRAVTTGPKKVLVLDLDNTLWGGIVGEEGPLGIALGDDPEGEAYRRFQSWCNSLTSRGILLAVASKNNPADAKEPFEKNPDMILSLEDFVAFEACWEPKSVMIRRIAETLNLGADSFVFADDNPAECEEVRQNLPEVETVTLPSDPCDYTAAISSGLWFEAVAVTSEDTKRTSQYRAETQRKTIQQKSGSIEEYLDSLEMVGCVKPINEETMQRTCQLIGKTNQFNLTTRRHSRAEIEKMLSSPGAIGLTLSLKDKFGDHGITGVLIAVPECPDETETVLRIDTLLMSCRIINRSAEQFFFSRFLAICQTENVTKLRAEYLPTPKNILIKDLLPGLGFEEVEWTEERTTYSLELPLQTLLKHHIRPADD